jgi:hypothetical protein
VCSAIFVVEAAMKLIAMSPKHYFQDRWCIFDFSIVTFSLLEMALEDTNLPGISAIRAFQIVSFTFLALNEYKMRIIVSGSSVYLGLQKHGRR